MRIEIAKDSIFCKVADRDREVRRKVEKLLQYRYTWFKKQGYTQVKHSRLYSFFDIDSGIFLAGFLPRVLRKFPSAEIEKSQPFADILPPKHDKPTLVGVDFRDNQLRAIRRIVDRQRGVVKFATASGKTVIAGGVISCFDARTVFLCNTVDIITQTWERFKEYGLDAGILTGSKKKALGSQVICATIQTYIKYLREEKVVPPQVVLIDECHHVQKLEGQYGELLQLLQSPIKIGFTGTLPNTRYGKLCLEGLVGPVISRLSIVEGIKEGFLSQPKITLIPVPKDSSISKYSKFYDVKDYGVIYNVVRNNLIVSEVKKRVLQEKSCLIIVEEIRHGEKILAAFSGSGVKAIFLQGKSSAKVREQVKQQLVTKQTWCVITTKIWNEGIDIPSLDVVVLGFVGKATSRSMQAIGRGLRRTEEKDRVEIIDFLDPYKFLASHLVLRLTTYVKEGLM